MIIQTEHIKAVEIADEIYSVPGLDAVFVGPNDLEYSMRIPTAQNPARSCSSRRSPASANPPSAVGSRVDCTSSPRQTPCVGPAKDGSSSPSAASSR